MQVYLSISCKLVGWCVCVGGEDREGGALML